MSEASTIRLTADWLHAPATLEVLDALGRDIFFVGGCVRNTLLGEPVHDIDVSTPLRPTEVSRRAEAAGLKALPTGIDHGTVTVVAQGQPFEVTTFRADVETDGRHAAVRFSTDIAEDAIRRDFTMNALYTKADGALIDPLGGLNDLRARRIRFILKAEDRIREDALRILRFFRFTAWYGDSLDAEGLAACAALADLIEGLARERIGAEMARLLNAPDPGVAVAAMARSGVLNHVFSGANATALPPLVAREQTAGIAPDWRRRLAAMTPEDALVALRLSKSDARHIQQLTALMGQSLSVAHAAALWGTEIAMDYGLIQTALAPVPWHETSAEIERGLAAHFPLKAADLIEAGMTPGPDLGAALKQAKEAWLQSEFRLDREMLLNRCLGR